MKLKTVLQTMEPSDYIKIGTQTGSNFFYAGTVREISEQMDSMTGRMRRKTKFHYARSKESLDGARERWEKCDQSNPKNQGAWQAMNTRYKESENALRNFVPLAEREVLEHFAAEPIIDDVPDVMVAIITGSEYGTLTKIDKNGNGVVMK